MPVSVRSRLNQSCLSSADILKEKTKSIKELYVCPKEKFLIMHIDLQIRSYNCTQFSEKVNFAVK